LFEPTPAGIESALRRTLSSPLRPARPAFDDAESLRRWDRLVGARPEQRRHAEPAALAQVRIVSAGDTEPPSEPWVVLLDESDEPADGFLATLLQAQAATDADVVTCGITLAGVHHVFLGEPGALGVLSNSYGGAALIRRSLLEEIGELPRPAVDPDWSLLARLSATGARIVSIPDSLLTRQRRPGDLRSAPADALLVVDELERVLPPATESLARLAAGLAATATTPPSTRTSGLRRLAVRARRLQERIGRP
jgi:hypothetical protein